MRSRSDDVGSADRHHEHLLSQRLWRPELYGRGARTRIGRGQVCHEHVNVGLSNETVTPVGVTVRWAISRTVTKVPSVPFTRTCEVVVVTKLRLLLLSLKA